MMLGQLYRNLYNFLLNFYRLRHCFKNIGKEFGFFDMFKLCFLNLVNKSDKVIFLEKLNIYVKPNFFIITTLIEIFNRKLYKNLKGLNYVLDVGGYIGESSIYLARNNNNIVVFEPSKEKFELLEKNISSHDNIVGYNYALVEDENIKELTFYERTPFDFCSSSVSEKKLNKKITVLCKDIFSLLERYKFDGLKMDIEGGEFPIIEELMRKEKFIFKKGIIEFHFVGERVSNKRQIFENFYNYLIKNNYGIRLFDNDNGEVDYSENIENVGLIKNLLYLNLEFIKNEK